MPTILTRLELAQYHSNRYKLSYIDTRGPNNHIDKVRTSSINRQGYTLSWILDTRGHKNQMYKFITISIHHVNRPGYKLSSQNDQIYKIRTSSISPKQTRIQIQLDNDYTLSQQPNR